MENAVIALELEFKRVTKDLEYTSRTIETELQAKGCNIPNLFKLIERIKKIEFQIERIKNKSTLLIEKRELILINKSKELLKQFEDIKRLMLKCHIEINNQDEDIKESFISTLETYEFTKNNLYVKSLNNEERNYYNNNNNNENENKNSSNRLILLPSSLLSSETITSNLSNEKIDLVSQPEINFTSTNNLNIPSSSLSSSTTSTTNDYFNEILPLSTSIQAIQSASSSSSFQSIKQFNGIITQEEFSNVPSHIRGRCSLADTQRILTKLRVDFQQLSQQKIDNKRNKMNNLLKIFKISVQNLDQMGYRVCGQTGTCILKTLVKLGYIELSKKGDTITMTALGVQGI